MKRIIAFVCAITLIISSLVVTNAADESTNTNVKVIGVHKSSTKNNICIVLDSLPDTDIPGSTTYSGFTVDVVKETTSTGTLSVSMTSHETIESCVVLSMGDSLSEAVDYDLILTGSATDTENTATITLAEELNIHIDSNGKVYEVMSTDLWPGTNHDKNLHHVVHMQSDDLSSKLDSWSEDDIYSEEGDATESEAVYLPGFQHVTLDDFASSEGVSLPEGVYPNLSNSQATAYYLKDETGAPVKGTFDKTLFSTEVLFNPGTSTVPPLLILGGMSGSSIIKNGFAFYPNKTGTSLTIVNYNQGNYPMTAYTDASGKTNYLLGYVYADDVKNTLGASDFSFVDNPFVLQLSQIDEDKFLYQEYVDYVTEYCNTFNPKLLRYDHYPFTAATAQGSKEPELDYYFGNMSVIRDHAVTNGISLSCVVQAGGNWNDNGTVQSVLDPFPAEGQFRWNVNTYLAFGAKSINYFPLIQPWGFANAIDANENETRDYDRNGLIGGDGETNQWYDWAKEINQHIGIIDEVLMNSENKGLLLNATEGGEKSSNIFSKYTVTNLLSDFDEMNSDYIAGEGIDTQYEVTGSFLSYKQTTSEGAKASWREVEDVTGNAMIGCFDFHGKTALYVVNYDMDNTEPVTITLNFDGAQKIKKVQKAKTSYETIEADTSLELSMDAGEGVLIVIQ